MASVVVPLALALSLSAAGTQFPDTVVIAGPSPCETSCNIELEPVATLGRIEDPVSLTSGAQIVRDSEGRFFAAPIYERGKVAVYGPDGTFEKTIGRPGPGPMELDPIYHVAISPGDTLFLLQGHRLSIWDPVEEAVSLVGVVGNRGRNPTGVVGGISVVANGQLVMKKTQKDIAGSFPRFHVVDREDASIDRSLGARFLEKGTTTLGVAPAGSSGLWSGRLNRYELERWELDGTATRIVQRDVEWFKPWEPDRGDPIQGLDHTRLRGIHEDQAGRLWVATIIPRTDDRARILEMVYDANGGQFMLELFQTGIEVLDPSSAEPVAFVHFDGFVSFLPGEGPLVREVRQDPTGLIVAEINRLRLRTPGRQP